MVHGPISVLCRFLGQAPCTHCFQPGLWCCLPLLLQREESASSIPTLSMESIPRLLKPWANLPQYTGLCCPCLPVLLLLKCYCSQWLTGSPLLLYIKFFKAKHKIWRWGTPGCVRRGELPQVRNGADQTPKADKIGSKLPCQSKLSMRSYSLLHSSTPSTQQELCRCLENKPQRGAAKPVLGKQGFSRCYASHKDTWWVCKPMWACMVV